MKDFNKALSYSFLLLKYRARSKYEIEQRLKRKKYSPSVIKRIIQYLEENKFLNDREFAVSFTAAALTKGWGPQRVDFSLKNLGVAAEFIQEALENKGPFKDKLEALINQKISKCPGPRGYQKLLRFLTSRGFQYQDIILVLQKTGLAKGDFFKRLNKARSESC
ncbi:MAG: RecX family transcriptional regulator [Candidatus Omnitrophica bacterium]|nr:RecX family transcriptional regulator [Candidatus Omnitrophota bacterium]MBU2044724.1 RecX family transcriptional regulator [Candidatus Omnitrophota bacterium]MBU2266157.1 RecX family transcriptional regulator [Candidatus Omnitrophota bacterium]MBU2473493.1 RecX family transcriptional regulator [Candidatus Omnitrophota bacterium]